MIAASMPLNIINTYRTNTDFYRVSAARGVASVRQTASRQPMNLPFERLAYSKMAQTAAANVELLVKSASTVRQTAQTFLSSGQGAALNKRVVVSSHSGALKGEARSGAALGSVRVQIDAVAVRQQNKGGSQLKAAASPLPTGWHEFEAEQNGNAQRFKLYVGAGETAEQTMGKIKSSINEAGFGIRAFVKDDGGGKAHLELESAETGTARAFALRDLSGSAVSALGLDRVEREAGDASYRLNGAAAQTSSSNDILLDEGKIKLTLLRAGTEEITAATEADGEALLAPLKELVAGYNQFQAAAQSAPGYMNSSVLKSLQSAAKPHDLSELGLRERADGTLHLDEETFLNQVSERFADVKKSLGGVAGLAAGLARSFGRMEQLPTEALFQWKQSPLQAYGQYRSPLQAYMPVSMSGLLLDQRM